MRILCSQRLLNPPASPALPPGDNRSQALPPGDNRSQASEEMFVPLLLQTFWDNLPDEFDAKGFKAIFGNSKSLR